MVLASCVSEGPQETMIVGESWKSNPDFALQSGFIKCSFHGCDVR